MSLLAPIKKQVKVYRSTDVGAPVADKSKGFFSIIMKACLVTGYGDKEGAGWLLTHEDAATTAKVFAVNYEADNLSLRITENSQGYVNIELVDNVVDANTATKVMSKGRYFDVNNAKVSGAWVVLATDKAFWFFVDGVPYSGKPANRTGVYAFAGIVPGTNSDGYVIAARGGQYGDDSAYGITQITSARGIGVCNLVTRQTAVDIGFNFIFGGLANLSPVVVASPLYVTGAGDVYQMPIYAPSRNDLNNYDDVVSEPSAPKMMNFCTSTQQYDAGSNVYVVTDEWGY